MTTQVDMWFDPGCPWAWMTSRWLLEAEAVRDCHIDFHVMSLAILNENREGISAEYRESSKRKRGATRVCIAIEQRHGQAALRAFYTAVGTRYHPGGEEQGKETCARALADCGLPAELIDAFDDASLDAALEQSHRAGTSQVGDDVGTPIIAINGKALFGPVISPAPKGEAAGELFDGFDKVTACDGFFELKRSRDRDPIFD